ncbi:MAG: hypothetical protein ACFB15_04775 [Cyclobacteriaceae bacterium]
MKTKAGIIIIILSFIGSLNPYWLIFTVPIFLIGITFLWSGENNFWIKISWTVLPLILWYPYFLLFMYLSGTIGSATAQKFDFIFDESFEGRAVLIGNIPCGQEVNIRDGREQIYVPDNGVALYQGEVKFGYINHRYYRRTKGEKLTELRKRANHMYFEGEKNPPPENLVGVWLRENGTKIFNTCESKIECHSMVLVVSSKDSIEKYYDFHYLRSFEILADSLFKSCELEY